MKNFPQKLKKSLENRKQQNAFRKLGILKDLTDFSSNDYLGFAASEAIYSKAQQIVEESHHIKNGATGSRLLSGNHPLYDKTEDFIAKYHQSATALIFNSGYDANIGFFANIPQRGDLVFYDESIHASVRDGILMGRAKAYKFKHNDVGDLKQKILKQAAVKTTEVYIVTESVFSMDGDSPDLKTLADFSSENGFFLVVDEAHAVGVFGNKGEGLVQKLKLQDKVFARTITFGKALGAHAAAILGSELLREYLVNFARSLIYTTALPPHSVATILSAYTYLETSTGTYRSDIGKTSEIEKLRQNIAFFKAQIIQNKLQSLFLESDSAIHCCIVPGNEKVKNISEELEAEGFDVKPILSPTVPQGEERLRFCLHSYNSFDQISEVLKVLAKFAVRS